jgi:hypothetical protein
MRHHLRGIFRVTVKKVRVGAIPAGLSEHTSCESERSEEEYGSHLVSGGGGGEVKGM